MSGPDSLVERLTACADYFEKFYGRTQTVAHVREAAAELSALRSRCETLEGERDAASARSTRTWQELKSVWSDILGDRPRCRDCADHDGRCQGDGPPCNPTAAAIEKALGWKAARDAAVAALEPFAAFAEKAGRFVQGRADFGGSPIMPTKHFRLADFRRAAAIVAEAKQMQGRRRDNER